MSKEELALFAEREKESKSAKKEEKKDDAKKDDTKPEKVKELELDIENAEDRVIRLTPNSSSLMDAILSKDGEKIYYITSFDRHW